MEESRDGLAVNYYNLIAVTTEGALPVSHERFQGIYSRSHRKHFCVLLHGAICKLG
jgi:hypothetical protein